MSPNEAIVLAIMAGVEAKARKAKTKGSGDHPATNIAMLAYWDGVANTASHIIEVFDGKETPKSALALIGDYATELRGVLQEMTEGEHDDNDSGEELA